MPIFVIRHGLSFANDNKSLAFASSEAHLMPEGIAQASQLGFKLRNDYSIDPQTTEIAVSQFNRASETASSAGFTKFTKYPLLNEITHGMNLIDLRASLDRGVLPQAAIEGAEYILEHPPTEAIWVTHGLVIAGLCKVLGIYQKDNLIPRFCEIRQLPIDRKI